MSLHRITRVEAAPGFVLYHLDAPKAGHTAIVAFRGAHDGLEPTLATLHRHGEWFDFEIDPSPLPVSDDPRLRTACRARALTLRHRAPAHVPPRRRDGVTPRTRPAPVKSDDERP